MNQWVVWFNVLAFACLFCAFAFWFLGYVADRKPWMRSYLLYLASFDFWLILATWYYFRVTFITGPHPALDLVVGYTRVAVSLVIGYTAPLMVVQLEKGKAPAIALLLLGIVPALIVLSMGLTVGLKLGWLGTVTNLAFNGFQAAVAAWGIRVLRRATPDPRAASLRTFFRLSFILYDLLVLYVAVAFVVSAPVLPAVATSLIGVFGLSWSVLLIADQLRAARARTAESAELPPYFLNEYGITEREGAIIRLLSRGHTTKEIGRELYVSHRTVETHAHNIYRKCDVTNRVELLNLIDSCRTR
jgi:DNA-binding CsgD family transcriptional regulator